MIIATCSRALKAARPRLRNAHLSHPRVVKVQAVPTAFKLLYEDINLALQGSDKPLPKDAVLDLLDAVSQPEDVKQLIALLKIEAPRHESRAQKDWSFRMRVYKELAAKAVQLGSPALLTRLVEDSSELLLEKYFVKYLLQDLARQRVDIVTMELVLEAYRRHAKDVPALQKGLRGAYYETMLVAHRSGLHSRFLNLYSQGVSDGIEFSEGIKRAVTRLKNAPPSSVSNRDATSYEQASPQNDSVIPPKEVYSTSGTLAAASAVAS